eukprot:scaffold1411_cov30-Phaeocystis_antarctica.AAC.1
MANPAFRPDSEGQTLKDNDIIQCELSSSPVPVRTAGLGILEARDVTPLWILARRLPDFGRLCVSRAYSSPREGGCRRGAAGAGGQSATGSQGVL